MTEATRNELTEKLNMACRLAETLYKAKEGAEKEWSRAFALRDAIKTVLDSDPPIPAPVNCQEN